jgi:DNA-binding PadR family transcriptional regulator
MSDEQKKFEGFPDVTGNFTQVPNIAFQIMHELSGAEYKCLMYIIRHTYGFDEPIKAITLDEFQNGRKRRDGTRMDKGTGLSKQTIISALKSLLEAGYLIVEKNDSDKARKERVYGVNRMSKNLTSDVKKLDIDGQEIRHRTEKYTIDKNYRNTSTVASSDATERERDNQDNINAQSLSLHGNEEDDSEYQSWKAKIENIPVPEPVRRPAGYRPNPLSEDLAQMEIDAALHAASMEPTEEHLMTLAVERVLGMRGRAAGPFVRMLMARKGKGDFETFRLDRPATATELQDWALWYERKHPNLNKPTTPIKLHASIMEYRYEVEQAQSSRKVPPQPRAPKTDASSFDRDELRRALNQLKGDES